MKGEWLFHYGGFTIRDTDGNDVFQVKNHVYSQELYNMEGQKVAEITRKKMASRITYHIYSGSEMTERRATLNLRHSGLQKKAHVYIYQPPFASREDPTNIDDMEPDIIIKAKTGNNCPSIGEVEIINKNTGEEYAEISKEKAREVLGETSSRTFLLTVKSGVDVGFMVMCAVFFNIAVKL
ncbi:hypothetical protein ACHWQZ_G000646 [Mnemiopsis leidyi]